MVFIPGRQYRNARWTEGQWDAEPHHKKPQPHWNYQDSYKSDVKGNQPTHWAELSEMEPSTLLEGPEPLSECLDLLAKTVGQLRTVNSLLENYQHDWEGEAWQVVQNDVSNATQVINDGLALLEKCREGGK